MLPLNKIFTQASAPIINRYSEPLERLMAEYGINTTLRQAHFFAQLATESGELRFTEENLKYSAARLLQVFPRYFKSHAAAQAVAYDPEKIANIVYANRIGNGDAASGDGYTFRGRGLIQLTGRANYDAYVRHLKTVPSSLLDNETVIVLQGGTPSHQYKDITAAIAPLLVSPEHAVRSACWFWKSNGLNEMADSGDSDAVVTAVSKRVNGGTNGLDKRRVYFNRALYALKNM